MNPRIKLVSDTEVEITRVPTFVSTSKLKGEFLYLHHAIPCGWDAEGRAALIDALQCLRDTGSFAAMSDASAVPYTGKRMRRELDTGQSGKILTNQCTIVWKHNENDYWYKLDSDTASTRSGFTEARFLPLTPAPRYRPYTPVEAAAHLGRHFKSVANTLPLNVIREFVTGYEPCASSDGGGLTMRYESFAECTWADDGTPCGVKEH